VTMIVGNDDFANLGSGSIDAIKNCVGDKRIVLGIEGKKWETYYVGYKVQQV